MIPRRFMLIAGEASGDALAAELVSALRSHPIVQSMPFLPEFFGAGGPRMAAAGVNLSFDLTQHAVFGLSDALRQYFKFRKLFNQLFQLALDREPDVIILVDYSGFNRRFAKAVKHYVRRRCDWFHDWNPKVVYYVSPQVWASREARACQLARDVDLLLSIFPFEKEWYSARTPQLRVEFVGHPLIDRFSSVETPPTVNPADALGRTDSKSGDHALPITHHASSPPLILLLPGSRKREIETHLPIMAEALKRIGRHRPARSRLVLPTAELVEAALRSIKPIAGLEIRVDRLGESLAESALALAASGTITLECAYFRVPTVVVYKTSWLTYEIARQIIRVKHIAMPNILAGEEVYRELIQNEATPERVANEALDLLNNIPRRETMQRNLARIIQSLGRPGASARAADAILALVAKDAS
ncbi:MAG: lipid-A-disaccharide synthase [Verrucomicrobia bacterium]|nr:lipid-A-disaccharide synthase [Verrucomicrobiota bacterium]